MYRFINTCCLALLLLPGLLKSQIEFSTLPADLQLIARAGNTATFEISGKCTNASYTQLHTIITTVSGNSVIEDKAARLYPGVPFSIIHHMPVQLAEYNLSIYLGDGTTEFLFKTVSRLLAGDYFIIAGQSNALAASDNNGGGDEQVHNYSRPWLRGLGNHDDPFAPGYPCSPIDFNFYQSNSNWLNKGFVGTWGLKLQYDLSAQTGVPLCMINGARAGSSMDQNLASHTPSDTSLLDSCNLYDRLYRKAAYHHLNKFVRALFWYQGETDAALPVQGTCDYINKFNRLYTSWKNDYPNLEKIFLMQLNTGCSDANLSLVREIQRKISYQYPDVCIMSTFSADTSDRPVDQCHFTIAGYNKLADNLLPLVKKYIYKDSLDEQNILPPKIVRAYYSGKKQVCLEFDKNIVLEQYTDYGAKGIAYMKDYFYGEGGLHLNLSSVSAKNNLVYLNLPDGTTPKKITYLPNSYSTIPTLYTGPWILSQANDKLSALSFYDFPITSAKDNGWNKLWTNFGSNQLNSIVLDENSRFYKGDFNGDGVDELLCINDKAGRIDLLSFINNQWKAMWTNNGDTAIGKDLLKYNGHLIAADFNGDGRDELLGSLDTLNEISAGLFKFSAGGWQQLWQAQGQPLHPIHAYGKNLCAGDFDGNGSAELLGSGANAKDRMTCIYYNGTDFVTDETKTDGQEIFTNYKRKLLPADYNNDGTTDVLGMTSSGISALFTYKDKAWKQLVINNGKTAFIQAGHSGAFEEKNIAGKLLDNETSIMALQGGAAFMKLSPVNALASQWQAQVSKSQLASVSDWPFDATFLTSSDYFCLKAGDAGPDYLLAMRRESCGYLAGVYRFGGQANPPEDSLTTNYTYRGPDFIFYPNPTTGLINIDLPAGYLSHVTVLDEQGRTLVDLKNQSNSLALDLGFLDKGLYLLKVDNTQSSSVKKLIKK